MESFTTSTGTIEIPTDRPVLIATDEDLVTTYDMAEGTASFYRFDGTPQLEVSGRMGDAFEFQYEADQPEAA